MRKFGEIEVSTRDYERLVKRYIRFWKKHSECTDRCPLGYEYDGHERVPKYVMDIAYDYDLYPGSGHKCFCTVLPMFPGKRCPCVALGRKAFDALDEFIKEYGKEFL